MIFKLKVLHDHDFTVTQFCTQCRLSGQVFNLLVQLEAVVARTGPEDGSTMAKERIFDITCPGRTGSFLFLDLPGRSLHITSFLGFVRTLSLGCSELLHSQIYHMLVGFNAKDGLGQINLFARFASVYFM